MTKPKQPNPNNKKPHKPKPNQPKQQQPPTKPKNPTNSVLNGGRTHPHLITRMEFTVRVKPAFQD